MRLTQVSILLLLFPWLVLRWKLFSRMLIRSDDEEDGN
jgi:hypothetical protein